MLVGFAYRISPVDVLPARGSAADLPAAAATRYRVNRRIAGNAWTLYDGTDPGVARRTFEGVRDRKELGYMEITQDDGIDLIIRGTYERLV